MPAAPAKLNRFLHIAGRRDDGYHTLQTGYQFLTLADDVAITITDDGCISEDNVPIPDNLCLTAARRLQQLTGTSYGARICVTKRIPIGAGLGGGSSDAATTLLTLNRLWQCELPVAALQRLGATIGSDVPFFIGGRAGIGEGIGDRISPHDFPEQPLLVCYPGVAVSSAAAYALPSLPRAHQVVPHMLLADADDNDFTAVIRAHYPAVDDAFGYLAPYGTPRLSGSGSSVFVYCEAPEHHLAALRSAIANRADSAKWQFFATHTLNAPPLHLQ